MFGNGNGNGKGKGISSLYDLGQGSERVLDAILKETVANQVIDQINREFPVSVLRSPTDEERQHIQERINALVGQAFQRSNAYSGYQTDGTLAAELGRRLMGLGFLDLLLPPARTDLSEICIYSSGLVQVMKKNSVRWETLPDLKPDPFEIIRVLDRILGPQNKSLNEANPTVNAKLPATPYNPGGGRIKALHPVVAPPGRNPSINIRLFEQKPVLPAWILERQMMSPEMMALLQTAMEQGYRILITGGTRTGKTTLLSALCNYLPSAWRIVKIEDPEEIWIERPTVQTIEARPAALGTEIQPYTLANAVDDALRMAPDYLILGEVRDGHAGLSLFRALMTGHSGACTFHADNPREAVRRLTTVLGADAGVGAADAIQLIAEAVDLLVQIGIRNEVRRVTVIANLSKEISNGDIRFEPVYRLDEQSSGNQPHWE
ncbi:MAG: Flp pilus assembly complex ATPase component TadA, partial [Anaerolineales bacterium]|nr:Flp pilus assembly complex ATPase component TadA [Anaerolineales bacterium]